MKLPVASFISIMLTVGLPSFALGQTNDVPGYLPKSWPQAFDRAEKLTKEARQSVCKYSDRVCALGRLGLAESALSIPEKFRRYCATLSEGKPASCTEPTFVPARMNALKASTGELRKQTTWARSGAWMEARKRPGAPQVSDFAAFLELTKTALRESKCSNRRRVCIAGRVETVIEVDQLIRTSNPCQALPTLEAQACNTELWRLSIEIGRLGRDQLSLVLSSTGWVDAVAWGPFIETDAFVLVQHLDDDPQYQAWALARLKTAMSQGKVDPSRYAYLSDRVEIGAGREQLYGTQGTCSKEDGKGVWRALPIRDPGTIEERRAAFRMMRFSDYRLRMSRNCP